MDENMNQIPEQEPETTDAFLDGWDGEAEVTADQPEVDAEPMETGEKTPAEDPSESAETLEEGTKPPADAEQAAQTQQTEAETVDARPQTWELRHMGEVRQANEAEMVALAQKGMDYDRIRTEMISSTVFSGMWKTVSLPSGEYSTFRLPVSRFTFSSKKPPPAGVVAFITVGI